MKIFVLGIFGAKVGGASGECLGAVQLWRMNGLDVDLIPTWTPTTPEAMKTCHELGCQVHDINARDIHRVPGLAGSTVVSFCNDNALQVKRVLRRMGCRFIFAPLMCFLTTQVRNALAAKCIDDVVFQSAYQRSRIEPHLLEWGFKPEQIHMVRGYIHWADIPFRPLSHEPGTPFVIGRAARARASKWHQHWWKMYERVPDRQAILLGTDEGTRRQIGRPPQWATVYKPGEISAEALWSQLHAHVTCNSSDAENWPRTGLECMACGVPTCAENRFGWAEMLQHGVTGMLGETPEQIGDHAATLAQDEELRMSIAHNARKSLETEVSSPDAIWQHWKAVLRC